MALDSPLESGSIGCLTLDPNDGLLACAQRNEEILLLQSLDFGQTWTTMIDLELNGVARRTGCASDSDTIQQCTYTCDDFPATCRLVEDDSAAQRDSGMTPADTPMAAERTDGSPRGCAVQADRVPQGTLWLFSIGFLMVIRVRRRSVSGARIGRCGQ